MSSGLQWNMTNMLSIKKAINPKTQSFIQIFPLKSSDTLGEIEMVHYYSVPLYENLFLRGYNQYYVRNNEAGLYYPWVDLIYAIDKKLDVYGRMSYLSSNDAVFGNQGFEFWVGFRVNFAI